MAEKVTPKSKSYMEKNVTRVECDNQNFFQLAAIQSCSLGVPALIVGHQLSQQYGVKVTICSILIGNLILWLVAIAVISMMDKERVNALENFVKYIGRWGALIATTVLLVAFLNWYAMQIDFSVLEMRNLFKSASPEKQDFGIRVGAALGLLSALLSIGGIRLLRKLTAFSLPILIGYNLYALATSSSHDSFNGAWGVSFGAVVTSVLLLLPGVINFPTFFRHSRSTAHSILGLTLLTIFISFFEISTIWMSFTFPKELVIEIGLLIAYLVVTLTYCNMLNIYLASACWEMIAAYRGGGREFAIIGLLGTLTYTFVQVSTPVKLMQDLTNAYLAVLGIVLLMAYLIRLIVRHRPRKSEKAVSLVAWLFGCIVATAYETQHFLKGVDSLLAGVNASILFFLLVIFIEETAWAVKKKWSNAFRKTR